MAQRVDPVVFREDIFPRHDEHGPAPMYGEEVGPQDNNRRGTDRTNPITDAQSAGSNPVSLKRTAGVVITEKALASSPSDCSVQFLTTPAETLRDLELGPPARTKKTSRTMLNTGRKAHWVSRRVMLGSFVLALAGVIGHNGFYNSLVRQPIGDQMDQQRIRLLGNGFAYVIQALLVISIDIAFTQWLFLCLTKRSVTVKCLDAAYSATSSLLFLFSKEMYKILPDVVVLALTIAVLTVPTSIVTPGTLYIEQSQSTNVVVRNVSKLDISTADLGDSGFFHYSRPKNGPNGLQNTSLVFNSPRTILTRLITAAAGTGEILPLSAPGVNSSYHVQFWAPYVRCEEANATVAALIDGTVMQSAINESGASLVYSSYYAYVPDASPGNFGRPNERTANASRGSNELWLSYKRNGTGWDTSVYPKCPITEYRVCKMYNVSYHLDVVFQNGKMFVTYDDFKDDELGTPVPYPSAVVDSTAPGELAKLSYASWFWAFSDLLTGSLGLYAEDATDKSKRWFNVLGSKIGATALLGTSDLDCFFAGGWMYYNATYRPPSGQRVQDIAFARGGMPLDKLIPELSMNVTISLMSNILLSPGVPTKINVTTPVDVYAYHTQTLLISYGTALLAATAAGVMGLVAFARNAVRMDKSFSSTASATQHTHLVDEAHYGRRGSIPVPGRVREKRVKFQQLRRAGGGWGFVVDEEETISEKKSKAGRLSWGYLRQNLRERRLRGQVRKKKG